MQDRLLILMLLRLPSLFCFSHPWQCSNEGEGLLLKDCLPAEQNLRVDWQLPVRLHIMVCRLQLGEQLLL